MGLRLAGPERETRVVKLGIRSSKLASSKGLWSQLYLHFVHKPHATPSGPLKTMTQKGPVVMYVTLSHTDVAIAMCNASLCGVTLVYSDGHAYGRNGCDFSHSRHQSTQMTTARLTVPSTTRSQEPKETSARTFRDSQYNEIVVENGG